MYIPAHDRNTDQAELLAFMRAHSFATLVTSAGGTPFITHLPLVVADDGERVRISGHVARANPHWRAFAEGTTVVVFQGPHAYVSPAAYDSRQSVPTWNYVAVHASGRAVVLEDAAARRAHVEELIAATDASYEPQWAELTPDFRDKMLNAIVAFDLPVDRLEGRFKLSRNKTPAERERVTDALLGAADPAARATGELMRQCENAPETIAPCAPYVAQLDDVRLLARGDGRSTR